MKIKPVSREFLWMAAGALFFVSSLLVLAFFQSSQTPAAQSDLKDKQLELVAEMRLTLIAASEAEKSAVMAVTDQDSNVFAEQARSATAAVEKDRTQLGMLLAGGGTQGEKEAFSQFSKAFVDLRRIDDELLNLAVKNTNIKAYSLAFGPAADALKEMYTALSALVEKNAGSPEAAQAALPAFGAQTAALQIQSLLAPHIAEESDKKMDELEAVMSKHDKEVRKSLAGLAALPKSGNDIELGKAVSNYEKFTGVRRNILILSRENTNIRSLAVSLGEKRKCFLLCQDALYALQQAIQVPPVNGTSGGVSPGSGSLHDGKPAMVDK